MIFSYHLPFVKRIVIIILFYFHVGETTLGRIFNVLGEPVDERGVVDKTKILPIHRSAPSFIDLDTQLSIFETGIKVVDLLAPYRRGGKIGLFGGAGGLF